MRFLLSTRYMMSIVMFIDLIIIHAGMESDDESSESTVVMESVPDFSDVAFIYEVASRSFPHWLVSFSCGGGFVE